ncbi:MAG: cytidylate kinase-like family protein [Deltaproteobacteria bacterium]|nr:cytidylate kinase-like family protein [Deltaproteobacteria bacterium]MBW1954963.1 cytidylate kinase-like family protein [Deltaproteobacteria bacterium]MBW2041586.1 cytidylate kinase-like family protein [Deltaproteobacteria bacterium]MBW2131692.1 cytidylate kinase-like family protein [Deltaproteobacteria bacterium]
MAVITISRQFGAGGRTLGQKLAHRLGYTFADNNIIQMLAKEANVSINWVESFEKEAGSRLSKLISSIVSQKWIDRALGGEYGYLDEQIYLDYLVLIIARMADEGNVVILGRGSQYILDDHPDAVHILMIDNLENRIQFMMKHYDLTRSKAERVVHTEDKRRANLYSRLGKTSYEDPSLYHLVLNMGRVDLDTAVELVVDMVE